MLPAQALARLALQKRFLLAESEARRIALTLELHQTLKPVRWLDWVQSRARLLLVVGLPVAGFWFARRSRGVKRWLSTGVGTLHLLQNLRRLLRRSPHR